MQKHFLVHKYSGKFFLFSFQIEKKALKANFKPNLNHFRILKIFMNQQIII